jgi:maltose/moltooligosaccharide transporter
VVSVLSLREPDGGFRVGTLVYSRAALLEVVTWMLWADLCFQIMEQLPTLIPLQLRALGASDTTIGFIKDSLTAIMAVFLAPIVGTMSDNHRGRLGRRRPYLLWSTAPVCAFLIALGFVEQIADWGHSLLNPAVDGITPASLAIVLIACFAAGFHFFNTFLLITFQSLIADVIPKPVLGRFVGLFRAVGALGGFAFNHWFFAHAEDNYWAVYSGAALLYAAAFVLLVWRVKEGEYPPPPPRQPLNRPLQALIAYFRACYCEPFYLKMFTMSLLYWVSAVPFLTFIMFFAMNAPGPGYAPTLGMDAAAYGDAKALTFLPKIFVAIAVGPLIDRFEVLRVLILALIALAISYLVGFFVSLSPTSFTLWWVANEIITIVFLVAYLAMFPTLLPQARYGQLFAANQVFFSIGLVIAPIVCGAMLDAVQDYRLLFLWSFVLTSLSAFSAILLRRDWIDRDRKAPE